MKSGAVVAAVIVVIVAGAGGLLVTLRQAQGNSAQSTSVETPSVANPGASGAGSVAGGPAGVRAGGALSAADSAVLYSRRSTHSGVYTAAQATRGEEVYAGMCRSCHLGLGNHAGPLFRQAWGGYTLADLYDYMATQMPKDNPGALSSAQYTDVVAYLLKMNGWPTGRLELPADSRALGLITIDTSGSTNTERQRRD